MAWPHRNMRCKKLVDLNAASPITCHLGSIGRVRAGYRRGVAAAAGAKGASAGGGGAPHLGHDVAPGRAAQTAHGEAGRELVPALSRLQGVAGDAAARQGLDAHLHGWGGAWVGAGEVGGCTDWPRRCTRFFCSMGCRSCRLKTLKNSSWAAMRLQLMPAQTQCARATSQAGKRCQQAR